MKQASRTAPDLRPLSPDSGRWRWRWLVAGALVESLLIGALFSVPFSRLWGTIPSNATATGDVGSGATGDLGSALAVMAVFGLPTLVPFVFVARRRAWIGCVAGAAVLAAVVLLALPAILALVTWPCCADDALDYVNRQRLWTVYGGNPFSAVPNDHPEDWSYAFAQFRDSGFGYGPLWWVLTRAFTGFATTLDQYLIGLKVLASVCFGVSVGLIWWLSPRPERLANALFFAWNPVVLLDGVLRLHNDLLIVPFVLAAVLVARRRPALGLPLVALASLIKLLAAPLGVVLMADLVRARRLGGLALGLGLSLVAAVALYAPFWFGPATLSSLVTQANRAQWSLGAVLQAGLQSVGGDLPVMPLARMVTVLVFASLLAMVVRGVWRAPLAEVDEADRCRLLAGWGALSLLAGVLTMPLAVYGHYLMAAIGLSAISGDRRVRTFVLVVSVGTMVNTVLGIAQFAGGPRGERLDQVGTVVLLGGVLIGLRLAWQQAGPGSPRERGAAT